MGEMLWKFLHSFTPSPRRPRPLGGSVINGTIQQLLDTPRAEPVTTNLAGDATQRHTAAQRGFIHEDAARPPLRRRAPSNPHYQVESAQPISRILCPKEPFWDTFDGRILSTKEPFLDTFSMA